MGATEERLNPLKMRIVIIGSTGSGKSALVTRLAAKLQISHTELDNLHWLQDWHERPDTEFRELVDVATPQSAWVIDSGYPVLRDLVWGRADVIIWLNYSFATTAWQLLLRTIRRNTQKVSCCNGNYESFKRSLGHDSILLWLRKTYSKNRSVFPLALTLYPDSLQVVLRSPAETSRWLAAKHR